MWPSEAKVCLDERVPPPGTSDKPATWNTMGDILWNKRHWTQCRSERSRIRCLDEHCLGVMDTGCDTVPLEIHIELHGRGNERKMPKMWEDLCGTWPAAADFDGKDCGQWEENAHGNRDSAAMDWFLAVERPTHKNTLYLGNGKGGFLGYHAGRRGTGILEWSLVEVLPYYGV